MPKFIPQYEDEKISLPAVIFSTLMILGGFFSLAGFVLKIINGDFSDSTLPIKLIILVALLPVFIWFLVSRLKNYHDNLKNRAEILAHGQKFAGEVKKIVTKKDREYDKTFMRSTKFFELDANSYAIVGLGREENYFEIQTPPILYILEPGEPVDVYYLNGYYYVDNPRMH